MADVSALVQRIRSFGANVAIDGGRLRVVNGARLPSGALDFIKAHGGAIFDYLEREAEFEERAAIMEYDGGLNRAVAEYVTKLLLSNPPEGASLADWSWYVSEGAKIAERGLAA